MKKIIIIIHWLTVILIVIAFLNIEYRSTFGKHTVFYDIMKSSHLYSAWSETLYFSRHL